MSDYNEKTIDIMYDLLKETRRDVKLLLQFKWKWAAWGTILFGIGAGTITVIINVLPYLIRLG